MFVYYKLCCNLQVNNISVQWYVQSLWSAVKCIILAAVVKMAGDDRAIDQLSSIKLTLAAVKGELL